MRSYVVRVYCRNGRHRLVGTVEDVEKGSVKAFRGAAELAKFLRDTNRRIVRPTTRGTEPTPFAVRRRRDDT